jgi:hypothetical protein
MISFEWKWGLLLGAVNFAWLVLSWALGFHERGIGMIQVTVALAFALTFAGCFLAMRALRKGEPETGYLEGFKAGALIAVISALVAVAGQFAYFAWINPEWTDYMVGETRKHYAALGLDGARIEEMAEGARTTFGLASYATQAGVGALVQGVLFSTISFGIVKWWADR